MITERGHECGAMELYRQNGGRKLVVEVAYPGSIFVEMACLGQGMHDSYTERTGFL